MLSTTRRIALAGWWRVDHAGVMDHIWMRVWTAIADTAAPLVDLVLPGDCAGCGGSAGLLGVCDECAGVLASPAERTCPIPAPPGLPPCFAGGDYDGVVRALILAYKERGRRGLARPLGDALADAVMIGAGSRPTGPLLLVPVPSTTVAIRARQGDHMLRLARRVADRLARCGWPVRVASPVRALPKDDAVHLDRQARARVASSAFVVRSARMASVRAAADAGLVVLVDDVLTTGATLAAVARRLYAAGAPVAFAATVAATRLRYSARDAAVEMPRNRNFDLQIDDGGTLRR